MTRKTLVLLITIISLMLFAGSACSSPVSAESRDAGSLYVESLRKMDFDSAYDHVCTRCNYISLEEFTDAWDNIIKLLEITGIDITDPEVTSEDGSEYINYRITLKSRLTEDLTTGVRQKLTYYDGTAHVDFSYDSILSGYEKGSYIRRRTLKGTRGEIFALDGTILAENSYSDTVYINVSDSLDIDRTLDRISSLLPDADTGRLKTVYEDALEREYSVITVKAYSKGTMDDDLRQALLSTEGVGIDDSSLTYQRFYPYREVFSHIIGYTGTPSEADLEKYGYDERTSVVGKTGLEASYEPVLHSEDGYSLEFVNSSGAVTHILDRVEPVNGRDVRTTLDIAMQTEAYYSLDKYIADDQTGCVIVMDTKSGDVSAMVSNPGYDSNLFSFPIDSVTYESLFGEGTNQPLLNRATQVTLAPGSTIKPFTAAVAMDNNILTMNSVFPYKIEKNKWLPDDTDWIWPPISRSKATPGVLNMYSAIRSSDNIYFGWAAMMIGKEKFMDYFENTLHFVDEMDFDLPVKRGNLVNKTTEFNKKLLSDMGFGVGEMLIAPIQLISYYTCFENGCDAIKPRIVKSITSSDGLTETVEQEFGREVAYSGLMSEYTRSKIYDALIEVVKTGTAHDIYDSRRSVAAKTGTAVVSTKREISWIVAFYTGRMDESRIVLVMIDGPADEGDIKFNIADLLLKK